MINLCYAQVRANRFCGRVFMLKNIVLDEFLLSLGENINIGIFSTSDIAKLLCEYIQQRHKNIRVKYFINSKKQNKIGDLEVIRPCDIPSDIDKVIIASFSHRLELEKILTENNYINFTSIPENIFEILNLMKDSIRYYESGGQYERFCPHGHFYSTIPTEQQINKHHAGLDKSLNSCLAIDVNIDKQLENLQYINEVSHKFVFPKEQNSKYKYFYNNPYFSEQEGLILTSMMLKYKPARIIEVGSGFSTALMYDINNLYFNNSIKIVSIEPNPDRLEFLFGDEYNNINLNKCELQTISFNIFEELKENDLLFIDSSHVSKVGSDVNYIFFEILPRLSPGVIVHFHDILFPFEYPQYLHNKGCYWNENYIMRAFLEYNSNFKIEFFGDFMNQYIEENKIKTNCAIGSGSIYLRKIK